MSHLAERKEFSVHVYVSIVACPCRATAVFAQYVNTFAV